jgi:hypothetical protein
MSSIFVGKSGLRLRFDELSGAQLALANSPATAVLLCTSASSRIAYFDNSMNVTVAVLAVHPEADESIASNRLLMFKMPAGRFLNFDVQNTLEIDGGTKLYLYYVGGTAPSATSSFYLSHWG